MVNEIALFESTSTKPLLMVVKKNNLEFEVILTVHRR